MKKMWIALIATNTIWAVVAWGDAPWPSDARNTGAFMISGGLDGRDIAHVIQVDERGYVICSTEKPRPTP